MMLATVMLSVPFEAFGLRSGTKPASISPADLERIALTIGQQPRRRRMRRVWRNGGWVWVPAYRNYGQYRRTQVGNRRYRLVRRYYYIGGVRRYRLVRVYY